LTSGQKISIFLFKNITKGVRTMRTHLTILSAALVLAMAFTFSCSADDLEKLLSDQSSSSSHKGSSSSRGNSSGGTASVVGGTVKIGTQTWMKKNLDVAAAGSKCYDNDPANCAKYGRLYDWATAQTVCPANWHLPSDAEWDVLMKVVGGSSTAGTKLKADSDLWNSNGKGTDNFGFSALPGGGGGSGGSFYFVGDVGLWWSATESNASYAYFRAMDYDLANGVRDDVDKSVFCSVRCVQD
jgi:uncharacterized protein (TIGR02145 family)